MVKSVTKTPPSLLGKYVRERRNALGLSLRDLAGRAGIDAASLSRLETGEQQGLQRQNARSLADALGIDFGVVRALSGELPGALGEWSTAFAGLVEITPSSIKPKLSACAPPSTV